MIFLILLGRFLNTSITGLVGAERSMVPIVGVDKSMVPKAPSKGIICGFGLCVPYKETEPCWGHDIIN